MAALNRGEVVSRPAVLKPIWWLFSNGSGKFVYPVRAHALGVGSA